MIGFDRPLKPEWIYQTLRMVQVGDAPPQYYLPFEDIAKELVGKKGKANVRTVLFRSFIYTFQQQQRRIEDNLFIQWAQVYSLAQLKPLFLAKILMDYPVVRLVVRKIDASLDSSRTFSSALISKKAIQEYGDRDVVRRSVRAFLRTLMNFRILDQKSEQQFCLADKFALDPDQVRLFLHLYARAFLKSSVVDLSQIDPVLVYFFQPIDFSGIALAYQGRDWEYIRDTNKSQLLMRGNGNILSFRSN